MYRFSWFVLELQSKFPDMIVYCPRRRVIRIAPHFVQKLIPCDYTFGMLRKESQQLELLGGHRDRLAIARNCHPREVDSDVTEDEHLSEIRIASATQGGAHSGQKLLRAERFCDVVIRAKFEKEDFVGNVRFRAQDNHRQRRGLSLDLAAHVVAGHP